MIRIRMMYLGTILFFVLLLLFAGQLQKRVVKQNLQKRNVVMNRIVEQVHSDTDFQNDDSNSANFSEIVQRIYFDRLKQWQTEYSTEFLPDSISFLPAGGREDEIRSLTEDGSGQSIWLVAKNTEVKGFLVFHFTDCSEKKMLLITYISIVLCFFLISGVLLYFRMQILQPFHQLTEYPERLSKGSFTEKIPESKNRYFGKFVWGVNMLNDKLSGDKKQITRLIRERQTMLTTIAHGIKTPVANIKLYADAIETGLYRKDGVPDVSDSVVAEKIGKNADEIARLVQEMITASSEGMVDFAPEEKSFYASELMDELRENYENRLKVLRTPLTLECKDSSLILSDKGGILRILSQLMENAVKYGDGGGITVQIERQEEGHYIYVRNHGSLIPENELPYLFNSFWRGSNAIDKDGSGIGLFEARQIALRLQGDIFVKRLEEKNEMEFLVYIP